MISDGYNFKGNLNTCVPVDKKCAADPIVPALWERGVTVLLGK